MPAAQHQRCDESLLLAAIGDFEGGKVQTFNIWFWLVEPVLNAWMLLDLAGNAGILACGLWGWALAQHEASHHLDELGGN